MNILVTGGCGFIGSHIVDQLIRENHEVTIIDDLTTGTLKYLNPKADFYKLNIRSENIRDIFEKKKFHIVFHMAAQIDAARSIKEAHLDADINIMGTINILENMKNFGVSKIIFPSSAAIYGNIQSLPIKENGSTVPVSFYGLSKLTAENYIIAYSDHWGLDYTIFRYSNVFGLRQGAKGECGVVKIFWDNVLKGQDATIFGEGIQTRDFIYILDVVSANMEAIYKGSKAIINISTGNPVTINQLFKTMQSILNSSISVNYKQERPGDIKESYLCNENAFEILNWKPKYGLQEGIEHMYNEYGNAIVKLYNMI